MYVGNISVADDGSVIVTYTDAIPGATSEDILDDSRLFHFAQDKDYI